jgi:Raf kinase inhibitor-like YbhB/YbcL family protein
MALTIASSAFREGDTIPVRYTCKGQGISPELRWSGAPEKTTSFAIITEDPDAPRGTFTHWVLFNLPAYANSLPENVPAQAQLSGGALQGKNDAGGLGYYGPCPPPGKPHRYYFILYALDILLYLKAGAGKAQVQEAIRGHVLAEAHLLGMFGT